ncbi:expressed unknown protein [Seminavis robusta]|uniref:Uncharacterized protein n=1 Tax=Seminavis robusta TaxID=568900 RepID=A0A9N8HFV7_9STRA|nr:expressed unknown protein [Seminavis robusta]|eukprot:Sro595_g172660.1 n/a (823) ;mRNA; f:41421-43967
MMRFSQAALCALVCAWSIVITTVHGFGSSSTRQSAVMVLRESFFGLPAAAPEIRGGHSSSTRLRMSFDPWGRRGNNDDNGMNLKGLQPDQGNGRGNSLFPAAFTEQPSSLSSLTPDQDDSVRFDSTIVPPGRNSNWNNNNRRTANNNNNIDYLRANQLAADQVTSVQRNSTIFAPGAPGSPRGNIYQTKQQQYRGPMTTATTIKTNKSPKGVSGFFQRNNNNNRKQQPQVYSEDVNYPSDNYNVDRQLRLDPDDPFSRGSSYKNAIRYDDSKTQYRSNAKTSNTNKRSGGFFQFGRSQQQQQVKKNSNQKGNSVYLLPPAQAEKAVVNQAQSFGPGFPANVTRSNPMSNAGAMRADQDDVKTARPLGYVEPVRVERADSRNATLGGTRAGVYQPGFGQGKVLNRGGGRYGLYEQAIRTDGYQQQQRQQQQRGNQKRGYRQQAGGGGGGRMGGNNNQGGRRMDPRGNGYYNYEYQENQRTFWNGVGAVTLATAAAVPLALQTLPPESFRDPLVKQFPQYKQQIDKIAKYRWDIKLPTSYTMSEYNFPTAEEVRRQMDRAGLSQDKLKGSISDGTERLDSFLQKMNKDAGMSDSFSKSGEKVDSLMDKLSKSTAEKDLGKLGAAAGTAAAIKSVAPPPTPAVPAVPASPPKLETPKAKDADAPPKKAEPEVKAKEAPKPAPAPPKEEVKAKEAPAPAPPKKEEVKAEAPKPAPAPKEEVKAPAPAPQPKKEEVKAAAATPVVQKVTNAAPASKTDDASREATLKEIERIRAQLQMIEEKRKALKPVNDAVLDETDIWRPRYVGEPEIRQQQEPSQFGGFDSSLF